MDPTTLTAAVRRFPLLGRPRPACPSLPERISEITEIADTAGRNDADAMSEAAHALNKAALVVSDCGLPDLAAELCWQHINVYRAADRPLTVLQARYMLEPVLNLARLHLRARDRERTLGLLKAMYRAVTARTDLVVDGRPLPLADLIGTRDERRKLLEWVWLHLLGDGVRALVLAGRWDDAVAHAQAHNGIGLHLMEGRQALIIAHCLHGASAEAGAALAEATPEQPWERLVASCLNVMCTDEGRSSISHAVTTMVDAFLRQPPAPGYAPFRAQLGLTVATLAAATDTVTAANVLHRTADEALESGDGYAARDVLRYRSAAGEPQRAQRAALTRLANSSGMGAGTLPEPLRRALLSAVQIAIGALTAALRRPVDVPARGIARSWPVRIHLK